MFTPVFKHCPILNLLLKPKTTHTMQLTMRSEYLRQTLYFTGMLFMPFALMAQDEGGEDAAGSTKTLFDHIADGGWAMWPLGIVTVFMLYLIFYCFIELRRGKFVPDGLLPQLTEQMQWRDTPNAINTLAASPCVMSRSLGVALQKARPDWPDANKEKVEQTLVEMLEAEDNSIGSWVNYLNVVAAISPMIGLLGTVSGMIGAFGTIGSQGMGDPSALAGDIGQALMTTATGLTIGIPAMIFYFFFKNRLAARMTDTAQAASNLVDHLAGEFASEEEYAYAEEEQQEQEA